MPVHWLVQVGIGFFLGQKYCSCPSDEPWCCQTGWKLTFASNRYTHKCRGELRPCRGRGLGRRLGTRQSKVLRPWLQRPHCRHWPQAAPQSIGRQEDGGHQKPTPLQPEGENTTFPVQDHSRPEQTPLHRRQLVQVCLWGPKPQQDGPARRRTCGQLFTDNYYTSVEPEAAPDEQRGDFSHEIAAQEEHLTLGAMTTLSSIDSVTWDNVREQTTSDPTMRHLHDTILMGFPEDSRIMPELTRIYHQYRSDLYRGGGNTLPGQNRNPAITWPSSGNTTRRSPRWNVHER